MKLVRVKKVITFFKKAFREFKNKRDFFEQTSKMNEKLHLQNCERSQKPNDANISLQNISINIVFQREEFSNLCSILEKLIPNGKSRQEAVQMIKENNYHSIGWKNLGALSPKVNVPLEDMGFGKASLPKGCDYLKIKLNRPLPSLAYLSLCFDVSDSINAKLDTAHKHKDFTPEKFNYLKAIFKKGYSMNGYNHYFSKSEVQNEIEAFYLEVNSWINRHAKSQLKRLGCLLYYSLDGVTNPTIDWFRNNSNWLHVYNIGTDCSLESFISDDGYIFCFPQSSENKIPFSIQASQFKKTMILTS